jgi:hypothetical protein
MVLGTWLWSIDPEDDSTTFLRFFPDHTCVLQSSYWEIIEESDGACFWKLLMKYQKIKVSLPEELAGTFGFDFDFEHMSEIMFDEAPNCGENCKYCDSPEVCYMCLDDYLV